MSKKSAAATGHYCHTCVWCRHEVKQPKAYVIGGVTEEVWVCTNGDYHTARAYPYRARKRGEVHVSPYHSCEYWTRPTPEMVAYLVLSR